MKRSSLSVICLNPITVLTVQRSYRHRPITQQCFFEDHARPYRAFAAACSGNGHGYLVQFVPILRLLVTYSVTAFSNWAMLKLEVCHWCPNPPAVPPVVHGPTLGQCGGVRGLGGCLLRRHLPCCGGWIIGA